MWTIIIVDENTKYSEDWQNSQKMLYSKIFSVKQQFYLIFTLTYLCLHAGFQYNGIDCCWEWVEWLRLAVSRSVCASARASIGVSVGCLSGICQGTSDRASVTASVSSLSEHLSQHLSAVCQGICWGICSVAVWHLSGHILTEHLSGHLSPVCQGISWNVCCSNCRGVSVI